MLRNTRMNSLKITVRLSEETVERISQRILKDFLKEFLDQFLDKFLQKFLKINPVDFPQDPFFEGIFGEIFERYQWKAL